LRATVACCVLVPSFCSHCIKDKGFEREFLAKYFSLAWMRQKHKGMVGSSAEGLEDMQAQEGSQCEMFVYSTSKKHFTKKDQGQHHLEKVGLLSLT